MPVSSLVPRDQFYEPLEEYYKVDIPSCGCYFNKVSVNVPIISSSVTTTLGKGLLIEPEMHSPTSNVSFRLFSLT